MTNKNNCNIKMDLDFIDLKKAFEEVEKLAASLEQDENYDECDWCCDGDCDECNEDVDMQCYEEVEEDLVNAPKHYAENGAMECIDEMILLYGEEVVMNFCLCNIHKYRYRANMKGGALDKSKSDWYLAKYKELKEIVDKNDRKQYDMFLGDMRQLLRDGATLDIGNENFIRLYENFLV